MRKIFDPIRKIYVEASPEECIRQNLLKILIEELLYPKELISVEKKIANFVEQNKPIPDRRVDILCFTNLFGEKLSPLLMIECKATQISRKTTEQILGYNHFIKAPFVALANQDQILTGWFDPAKQSYQFMEGLPNYESSLRAIQDEHNSL